VTHDRTIPVTGEPGALVGFSTEVAPAHEHMFA
jgi:hypothetical protein